MAVSYLAYRNKDGIWIDPLDPAFTDEASTASADDESLPAIYVFSNARDGDGPAFAMAEDGTVLGSHFCSHWGYMRHDLHDRPDRREACQRHYPDGYRLIVLANPGEVPPREVLKRNSQQGQDPS